MPESNKASFDRRDFLKSAASGAVLVAAPAVTASAAAVSPSPTPPQTLDITGMKEKIALATRMLVREGIIGSSGHLSMRIPGTDHVLLDPGNVSREILTADDVVTVNLDARQIGGKRRKPDETEIHCGIYRARSDVMAVAHTHPVHSVSFTVIRKPILPVHMHGAIFADGVPVFDFVGHVNTRELGDALARTLGSHRAALIKMHGAAIVGASIEEAFVAAIQLEENAQQQLIAEGTGTVVPMTPEDAARCVRESWRPFSIQKRWQYYVEKRTAANA
jgi:ribulose-5-phosphate 4-epimerase/fuculose-1-phosphate aldolase